MRVNPSAACSGAEIENTRLEYRAIDVTIAPNSKAADHSLEIRLHNITSWHKYWHLGKLIAQGLPQPNTIYGTAKDVDPSNQSISGVTPISTSKAFTLREPESCSARASLWPKAEHGRIVVEQWIYQAHGAY